MSSQHIGRAGLIIATGTLTSRVLGLGRAIVLVYAVGSTGLAANAFATSIKIPNTIYTLIVTGALTAVLVPQITKAALAKDGGQRYINKLVTLAIVGSTASIPVMAVVTPFIINLLGSGWDNPQQTRLATLLAFWLLPQILFYSLYTVVGEVLNARSLFGPYAWSPVLNNFITIGGLLLFVKWYGADPNGTMLLDRWDTGAIALVAGSATLGVAVQGLVLFAFWRRAGLKFALDFKFRGIGLGTMGKVAFWTFLTVLIAQAVGLFNAGVLNLAQGANEPGLAAFELVNLIFILPHSIITITLVTANFTRMSESVHRGDNTQMKIYLSGAARMAVLTMTFFTFAMVVLAVPIVRIIQPAASYEIISLVSNLLIVNLLALVPYSLIFVFNRGFFVLSDTRTPFFIAAVQSTFTLIAAIFSAQLATSLIAYSLSILVSVILAAQTIATFLVLRRRIGSLGGRQLLKTQLQAILAAVVASVAGWFTLNSLGGVIQTSFPASSFSGAVIASTIVTLVMALCYLAVLTLVRNHDLQPLLRKISGFLPRR